MRIEIKNSVGDALGLGERELVSIVGAGGKTSLMYRLASELVSSGSKAVLSTTTRIIYPEPDRVGDVILGEENSSTLERVRVKLEKTDLVLVGRRRDGAKIVGFSPNFADLLFASLNCHLIVESDGARGRSFKIPASHEPPVGSLTSLYLIVVGADCFCKPINSEYVFRPDHIARTLGIDIRSEVSQKVAAGAILSERGYISRKPRDARACVFINKFQDPSTTSQCNRAFSSALSFAHGIGSDPRIERVLLGSVGSPEGHAIFVMM